MTLSYKHQFNSRILANVWNLHHLSPTLPLLRKLHLEQAASFIMGLRALHKDN